MGYTSTNRATGETPLAFFARKYQNLSTGYALLDVKVRATIQAKVGEVYLLIQEPEQITIYAGSFDIDPEPGYDIGFRDPVSERCQPAQTNPPARWLKRLTALPPVPDPVRLREIEAELARMRAISEQAAISGVLPDNHREQVRALMIARQQADPHASSRAYRAAVRHTHANLKALRTPGANIRIPNLTLDGVPVERVTIVSAKGKLIVAQDASGRQFRLPRQVPLGMFSILSA